MKKLFDKTEIKSIIFAATILGFIFSFRKWGYGETFIFSVGLYNWVFASISSAIVLLIYQITHKLIAKKYGEGLIAEDIVNGISSALKRLKNGKFTK